MSTPTNPPASRAREQTEEKAMNAETKLRVGRLATLGGDYPGMPEWFVQIWDDDVLFARVYGDTIEEARDRAAVIVEKFNTLSDRISSVLAKTEQNLDALRAAELDRKGEKG